MWNKRPDGVASSNGAILVFFLLFFPFAASACDMKNLSFGASIEETAGKYHLSTLGTSPDRESDIVTRGMQFCSTFPKDSIAVFKFIYGRFVELKLERRDSKGVLLSFAKEQFTVPEEKENPTQNTILFEPDNAVRSVIYKSEYYAQDKEKETLAVISKEHDELFKRIANAEKANIVKE